MNTSSNLNNNLSNYQDFLTRIDRCSAYRYGVGRNAVSDFYIMSYLQQRLASDSSLADRIVNDPYYREHLGKDVMTNFYTMMIMKQ